MARSFLLAATLVAAVSGQATTPFFDSSFCFQPDTTGGVTTFIADSSNTCVYWECLELFGFTFLDPRNCPLGTAVSSFFGRSSLNPCTESFNPLSEKFDCTRKKFDLNADPPCVEEYRQQGICKNGGKVVAELSICTCDCTGTGFVDWDCSKRQEDLVPAPNVHPNNDDPCPGGIPQTDFCREAGEPCQNGGRCTNQCLSYVCACVSPFTAGRNCETFDCTANQECLNGGTCSRGPQGTDQFASCECLPGFTGVMCEIEPSRQE